MFESARVVAFEGQDYGQQLFVVGDGMDRIQGQRLESAGFRYLGVAEVEVG